MIASVGHFKDLPKKDMGIDIDNDFAMQIESMPDKKKFLSQLKKEVKIADRILIALTQTVKVKQLQQILHLKSKEILKELNSLK